MATARVNGYSSDDVEVGWLSGVRTEGIFAECIDSVRDTQIWRWLNNLIDAAAQTQHSSPVVTM